MSTKTVGITLEIIAERGRQDRKFGTQHHPDGTATEVYKANERLYRAICDSKTTRGAVSWDSILLEEVYEALAENDLNRLRTELIQVAAVVVNWIEDIDSRGPAGSSGAK